MPSETLADLLAEAERLEKAAADSVNSASTYAERDVRAVGAFYVTHGPRLAAVARRTLGLFAALDYVKPDWRAETCVPHGDEVNAAWYELERKLGQGPDAAAAPGEETK